MSNHDRHCYLNLFIQYHHDMIFETNLSEIMGHCPDTTYHNCLFK